MPASVIRKPAVISLLEKELVSVMYWLPVTIFVSGNVTSGLDRAVALLAFWAAPLPSWIG